MNYSLVSLLAAVLCFSFSSAAPAQEDRRGLIGLTVGTSIPIGDFGDASSFNDDAGFAEASLHLQLIHFNYELGDGWGIAASWSGASYPLDLPGQLLASWNVGNLLAGPSYNLDLNHRWILNLRFLLGFSSCNFDFEGVGETTGAGLGTSLGANLYHHLSDRWSLIFGVNYLGANPNFDDSDTTVSIWAINLRTGAAYRLR